MFHIIKLGASAAAIEFREWVQVGIDEYIPHRKYQVKLHSSPWFLAACAVIEITFFVCNKRINVLILKVKSRQASDPCKRVLEAAKLVYASESITSQKGDSHDFWRIANNILNKVDLLNLLYSMAQRCCLLHLISKIVC